MARFQPPTTVTLFTQNSQTESKLGVPCCFVLAVMDKDREPHGEVCLGGSKVRSDRLPEKDKGGMNVFEQTIGGPSC
jgi:hypothetical protein